jgi:Uma2 family endonuclease
MGMAAPVYYTAEMVRALPDDGNRYETVHGELLVTPSPRELHQRALGRLFLALGNYLERHQFAALYSSPADLSWTPDTLVQPDLFVVALDEARTGEWSRFRTLLLAVEVLSPSSVRQDRFTKRRLYQEVGVATYWVVDADARAVEVWTPEALFPRTVTDTLTWHPAGAVEPFTLSVESLFRSV